MDLEARKEELQREGITVSDAILKHQIDQIIDALQCE